ncbi:cupin domain-containing protein [Cryobacterium sp. SO2]|uniref:cupin domain-containing protein n=1 Tax=Cryobacterium sp. SO2 TaxID=1897060 RepID=UPI00223D6622|nr:cupin domain-containing protein [Cryobacterium sp. SO2]WEO77853.1 cupin domain-containing protein [Cryobacterium sp. SO2]
MVTVRTGAREFLPSGAPIFRGTVLTCPIVGPDDVETALLTEVTFTPGSHTVWHRHEREQILIITAGAGIVADRSAEHPVAVGDVVIVPAGEEHWHGAPDGHSLSHIAVLLSTTVTLGDDVTR